MMNEKELLERYGDLELEFNNYYKYYFTYYAILKHDKLEAGCGGDKNDIYRSNLNRIMTLKELNNEVPIKSVYLNDKKIYESEYF